MGAKKTARPGGVPKSKEAMSMYILNVIPAEEFRKAYGKYNYAKSAK